MTAMTRVSGAEDLGRDTRIEIAGHRTPGGNDVVQQNPKPQANNDPLVDE